MDGWMDGWIYGWVGGWTDNDTEGPSLAVQQQRKEQSLPATKESKDKHVILHYPETQCPC